MNKESINKAFVRSLISYIENATIQKQMCETLGQLVVEQIHTPPNTILEIGCGTGFLTSIFLQKFTTAKWTVNDINKEVKKYIDLLFDEQKTVKPEYLFGDAETLKFNKTYDLIASSSCYQWFGDLPAFFKCSSKLLNSEGLFAFSTYGIENMIEIKTISEQGLTYYSKDEYITMLSKHFEVVHSSEEQVKLHFPTPLDVLKHIKATGVNGLFRQQWTKARLSYFCQKYEELNSNEGYPLTYHPMYFICKPL